MSGTAVVSADSIGAAARLDPQLRVPLLPRLRRGLLVRYEADRVVVRGCPRAQVFQGRSATTLLPALLALLDGTHTHADLAERLHTPVDNVFMALSLLWTCGVVEEGSVPEPSGAPLDAEVVDFLSRMGDSTGTNPSWQDAAARLHATRIEVFGDPVLAGVLCAELGAAVRCLPAEEPRTPSPGTTLVALLDDGTRSFDEVVDHCWDKGIRLVRLRLRGRTAELGPFVDPRLTPCLHCLGAPTTGDGATGDGTTGDGTTGDGTTDDGATDDVRPARDGDHALVVALFARELFALLSRTTPSPLPTRWRRIDLDDLAQTERSSATRAGCPRCSVSRGTPATQIPVAIRYEASIAMPPKEFADLKAHQVHYKASNLTLQRDAKTWPVAPRIALPAPAFDRLAVPFGAAPLGAGPFGAGPFGAGPGGRPAAPPSVESLSLLLVTSVGIRTDDGQKVMRWTATGGNLGSATAYAVVRDCPGVSPGVYGYVAPDHGLARLAADPTALPGSAPVTLVLTGDYRRVSQKYSAFALRILLLDSGCARAAAGLVGEALGVALSWRAHWDDDAIAALLGLDLDCEPVTAVVDLGEPT